MYGYVSFRVVLARWWLAKWFVLVTALPETLYLYNSKSSLNINRWKMFFFFFRDGLFLGAMLVAGRL